MGTATTPAGDFDPVVVAGAADAVEAGENPLIPVHTPIVFDIVDRWSGSSIGGCTYHVSHPGGRANEEFPVNANEAESRRLARFSATGHTPGTIQLPPEESNPDFPLTLDLRRR